MYFFYEKVHIITACKCHITLDTSILRAKAKGAYLSLFGDITVISWQLGQVFSNLLSLALTEKRSYFSTNSAKMKVGTILVC